MTESADRLELASAFPPVTQEQWRSGVDAVLARGRGELSSEDLEQRFADVLTTRSEDGLLRMPLYTADDVADLEPGLPGQAPFLRACTATGTRDGGWEVRQRVPVDLGEATVANRVVRDELAQGSTGVWLDVTSALADEPSTSALAERLGSVLDGVHLEMAGLALSASSGPGASLAITSAMTSLVEPGGGTSRLRLGIDPVAVGLAGQAQQAAELAAGALERWPGASAITVDATVAHEAGAGVVHELAASMAAGLLALRMLTEHGLSVANAASALEFRYAATADQFDTIAKLRAARLLWSRVLEETGSAAGVGQRQHAVTSRVMLTRYDPWVNLVRGSVACFAAGVGGADAVTVLPHDALLVSDEAARTLGRRLARNTQTILLAESHVAQVIDPAGGSWYVESFTQQVAETAWAHFTDIERSGGILEAVGSGTLADTYAGLRADRDRTIAHRRRPITGVSEFPNLDEPPPPPVAAAGHAGDPARPLVRDAEPFEAMRDRAAGHATATGNSPAVFLATLGPLAEHNARASFTANLFASGGVSARRAGTVDAESVGERFAASDAVLACVCGSDASYAEEALTVVGALRAAGATRIYLAGQPGALRDELDQAGVDEYVVAGVDAVDLVSRALDAAGVAS